MRNVGVACELWARQLGWIEGLMCCWDHFVGARLEIKA